LEVYIAMSAHLVGYWSIKKT